MHLRPSKSVPLVNFLDQNASTTSDHEEFCIVAVKERVVQDWLGIHRSRKLADGVVDML